MERLRRKDDSTALLLMNTYSRSDRPARNPKIQGDDASSHSKELMALDLEVPGRLDRPSWRPLRESVWLPVQERNTGRHRLDNKDWGGLVPRYGIGIRSGSLPLLQGHTS